MLMVWYIFDMVHVYVLTFIVPQIRINQSQGGIYVNKTVETFLLPNTLATTEYMVLSWWLCKKYIYNITS